MIYEDDVVNAVCSTLQADGWRIVSRAMAHERGDDIVALRAGQRLIVEAKGEGSSKAGTNRYGQSFNRGQVNTHVGVAVLRALTVASAGTASSAMALPDNASHRDIAGAALPALQRAGVGVFWVATDSSVAADLPWS